MLTWNDLELPPINLYNVPRINSLYANSREVVYLAGLIEGEGYIKSYSYPRKSKKGTICINRGIAISVSMTDLDVMLKYKEILEELLQDTISFRGPIKNGMSDKPLYEVRLYSDNAAKVMLAIYPYMGTRRQLAIEDALVVQKSIIDRKKSYEIKL